MLKNYTYGGKRSSERKKTMLNINSLELKHFFNLNVYSDSSLLRPIQSEDTSLLRTILRKPFGPDTLQCPCYERTPATFLLEESLNGRYHCFSNASKTLIPTARQSQSGDLHIPYIVQ